MTSTPCDLEAIDGDFATLYSAQGSPLETDELQVLRGRDGCLYVGTNRGSCECCWTFFDIFAGRDGAFQKISVSSDTELWRCDNVDDVLGLIRDWMAANPKDRGADAQDVIGMLESDPPAPYEVQRQPDERFEMVANIAMNRPGSRAQLSLIRSPRGLFTIEGVKPLSAGGCLTVDVEPTPATWQSACDAVLAWGDRYNLPDEAQQFAVTIAERKPQ